jgi:glycosyltransferase involved in cell wall biosynthesis
MMCLALSQGSDHRISIAIVGTHGIPASYGGFETIAEELATELTKRGFAVYVACESRLLSVKSCNDYRGVRLVYFPIIESIRTLSEVGLYDTLSVLWCSLRADLVYMLGCYSGIVLAIPRIFRKVIVVNVDGIEWRRRKLNPLLRVLLRLVAMINARLADYVIVDSMTVGDYYKRNYGIEPIYIPNGIRNIQPLDSGILRAYGVEFRQYYLVIARLEPENNIDLIIEGFKASGSNRKLVIVGPLPNRKYVRKLLRYSDKNVVFVGGIYEPRLQRTFRHNCYAYIHGHEVGGTNPSLAESLSCSNLVLALDTPYNRETSEAAALYFTKKPNDLAEKINFVERNPEFVHLLKSKAHETYLRKYTIQEMVIAFEGFLNRGGGSICRRTCTQHLHETAGRLRH